MSITLTSSLTQEIQVSYNKSTVQGTVKRPLCPNDFHDDSSLNKCNFSTNGSKISASSAGAKAMQMLSSWTASPYSLPFFHKRKKD